MRRNPRFVYGWKLGQAFEVPPYPVPPNKQLPNIKVLSVAPLLADAIKRIHFNESVSKLFE